MAVTRGKTRKAKQGGVVTQAMTLIALASSTFILLPAGRDIVANTLAILPGEAETRPLIDMAHPSARDGMWAIWGLNHCFIALLKIAAVLAKDKEQLKKLWFLTAATAAFCYKWHNDVVPYGGDLFGFVVVCGLQTLSIGYLAFA